MGEGEDTQQIGRSLSDTDQASAFPAIRSARASPTSSTSEASFQVSLMTVPAIQGRDGPNRLKQEPKPEPFTCL